MKNIKLLIGALFAWFILILGVAAPVLAVDTTSDLCSQAQANGGELPAICSPTSTNQNLLNGPDSTFMKIVNIIVSIAGIIAVIMIIIGGVMMITSNGDSTRFSKAKDTVIYTAIALVIILVARPLIGLIVNWIN